MKDLAKFIDEKMEWSRATFGEGVRAKGVTAHIRKELEEIDADPSDIYEWVDVILLAIDGAGRAGYSGAMIAEALEVKMIRNRKRKWPPPNESEQDLPVEHVR